MADQVFVPGLDLGQALQTVAKEGFAFVPRTLAENFRRSLQQEVQACPFKPVPGEIGPVRQETEECVIPTPMYRYPLVARLSGEMVALVRDHGRAVAGLEAWVPTAAFVQRYRLGALGITPHLDGKRFGVLVAVFTTKGSAQFSIHETRPGPVVARWEAAPGTLVLLRGPGLAGVDDGRPFHAVGGPCEQQRYSVSFRMDTRPAWAAQGEKDRRAGARQADPQAVPARGNPATDADKAQPGASDRLMTSREIY